MNSIKNRNGAFTAVELIIVMAVIAVLASMLLPASQHGRSHSSGISCINNLKQVGTAYRIWSNDNGDRYPARQTLTNGGFAELLTNANAGFLCSTNYLLMSNEMGQSPKVLNCPADDRTSARDFGSSFSNVNVSYLVGVSSDSMQPQSLLSGDRNLGPGLNGVKDYGYSSSNGRGNDVAIATNSKLGPVSWSLKMHSDGNLAGAGNILLGDGSAQMASSSGLRVSWQPHFDPTTNWPAGHAPAFPAIRVLFP